MFKEYSEKDESGKVKLIENGSKFDITPENSQKVNEELTMIYEEEYVFDILPSTEKEFKVVKDIILNSTKTFNLTDGAVYDDICKQFEII